MVIRVSLCPCNLSIILMLWMTRQAIVNLLYFSRQTYYVEIEQTIILIILPSTLLPDYLLHISRMMTPLTPFS